MTAVQRLKDKEERQKREREQAGAAAAKTMQLIDRFMRIVGKEPIKVDRRRLRHVWDVIEWWNEKSFPRAVPDAPLQRLALYGQYSNSMDFYGDTTGIRAKFGLGVSHAITEDEVLESIVGRLIHYGVPEDVLERAELAARKERICNPDIKHKNGKKMSTKTSTQQITEAEARRAQDRADSIKQAQQKLKIVDRFIRKLMDHPVTVKGHSNLVVRNLISMWNGHRTSEPFDQPVWSLGFYDQTGGVILYDANVSLGIVEKRSNCDAHTVSEADVLAGITKLLMDYGVPAETLEQAELGARREWGDQALAKVRDSQEAERLRHTIAALAIDVASHPEFGDLTTMWSDGDRSFIDIQTHVRDLGVAAEETFGERWVACGRDFIEDIETLAATFVRGSLEERDLMPVSTAIQLLERSGYETYAGLKKELAAMDPDSLMQTVTVELEGEFYPVKQVKVVTDTDVLDDGHVVLKVAEASR